MGSRQVYVAGAGAVYLLQPESGALPAEGDVRLAQVAAAFLGKQMEE